MMKTATIKKIIKSTWHIAPLFFSNRQICYDINQALKRPVLKTGVKFLKHFKEYMELVINKTLHRGFVNFFPKTLKLWRGFTLMYASVL